MHVREVIDILWDGIQSLRGDQAERIAAVWPSGKGQDPKIRLRIFDAGGKPVDWEIGKDGIFKVEPPGIGRSRKA